MFQIPWLHTAISFIVVQLTLIVIIPSQSQNLCKCFQTQKNLLRNSHCLEKLLVKLPCSSTMNTLGKRTSGMQEISSQQQFQSLLLPLTPIYALPFKMKKKSKPEDVLALPDVVFLERGWRKRHSPVAVWRCECTGSNPCSGARAHPTCDSYLGNPICSLCSHEPPLRQVSSPTGVLFARPACLVIAFRILSQAET